MIFYSKSSGGFYDTAIHGDSIPRDAVKVPADEHAALMAGQSTGKRIVADADGRPVLQDPAPPSSDDLAASARRKRDALLASSDWVTLRAYEASEPVPAAWVTYRQALRDVPMQAGFPKTIQWPTAPGA